MSVGYSPSGWSRPGRVNTKIGQCHRYSEYERTPIHTRIGWDSTNRPSTVPGWTAVMITSSVAIDTTAKPPW